jgi:hypothetical protein
VGGSATLGAGNTFAFHSVAQGNTRDYRNNIFVNKRGNSGATGKHYAVRYGGGSVSPPGLTADNNILLTTGTGGVLGLYNGADRTTLADWQSATGVDAASKRADPLFLAPTGTSATVNLHIPLTSVARNAGANVGVTEDFDLQARGAATSDIGADETPNDADLKSLVLSVGKLSPVFSTGVVSYSATVHDVTDSITVTATTADAMATVKVKGVAVLSGTPSDPINLNVGPNVISIVVTAQNGTTKKTYTVTVNRPPPDVLTPLAPTISAPGANALVGLPTNGQFTVSGKATDNQEVVRVEVNLNNVIVGDAALTAPETPSTNWSIAVTPVTGSNILSVQTFDPKGFASPITTRTFTVIRPLAVFVNTSLGSVTPGYTPSSYRQVGKTYTITATPKTTPAPGGVFDGWALGGDDIGNNGDDFEPARLGISESALQQQKLTFIFQEGLELTAQFVASPFAPVAGTYNGLIQPSAGEPVRPDPEPDGTASDTSTEGSFTASVMSTGAFSAKLHLDALTYPVSGAFDKDGRARFGPARELSITVPRTNKPSLIVELQIDLQTPGVNDRITGKVTAKNPTTSEITAVSFVDSDRAFYTGLTPGRTVDSYYLGAANAAGKFTVMFPAREEVDQTPGFTKDKYPQGYGYGTITVTKAGGASLACTLADGTAVTASATVAQTNRFPLFVRLYNKLGFLSGFVQLDKTQADSDMSAASLHWLRPAIGTAQYYPLGWTPPILVDMMGAKYGVEAGKSVVKAPHGVDLQAEDADGNVRLTFADGKLASDQTKAANLSTSDVVTRVPADDLTFTLTVNRTAGTFTGTIEHTDATKPTYNGVIYRKGALAGGYGFFLTKQPVPVDHLGESGGVTLIGQP